MATINLSAKTRALGTKRSRNEVRNRGSVPGIFYSKKDQPIAIETPELSLKPLVYTSETHLVNLKIEGKEDFTCVVKDVQFDPVTDKIIHFDLMGININEKIEIEVPVLYTGTPVGVRDGGIVQHNLHKLLVECFPNEIPDKLEVNISELKIGSSIHVEDLSFEKVAIVTSPDTVVVSVVAPRAEKVETPAEEGEAKEPEVIAKGKAEKEGEEEK